MLSIGPWFSRRQALPYPFLVVLVACGSEPRASGNAQPSSPLDAGGGDAMQTAEADAPSGASSSTDGASDDAASEAAPGPGPVSMANTTIDWKHWNYTLHHDNTIDDYTAGPRSIVDQTFAAIVLENDWVKVTLVPEFGARILSILYKPTGHEELYQNPVGAPYGYMGGSFYYNWLMVYGGIFPTLVEPEHGKAWLLPWAYEITESTADRVSVRMSITDDIDATAATPSKFTYGNTGLAVDATVTLFHDRSSVDMALVLTNTKTTDVHYEYWTCATLAPGSEPGSPRATANAEIIAPLSQIQTTWGGWLSGPEVRAWDQSLSLFSNWQDDGILYAYPSMVAPYWGVINHDAHEGLLRIADNSMTPGLKMWTWGYPQSQIDPTDPNNASNSARPYIELWGGVSHQFFTPATMASGASKLWTESYLPTIGLDQVTSASAYGAAHVFATASGPNVTFAADFFAAQPGRNVTGTLSLDGQAIGSATLTADPVATLHFAASESAAGIAAWPHQLGCVASEGRTGRRPSTTPDVKGRERPRPADRPFASPANDERSPSSLPLAPREIVSTLTGKILPWVEASAVTSPPAIVRWPARTKRLRRTERPPRPLREPRQPTAPAPPRTRSRPRRALPLRSPPPRR